MNDRSQADAFDRFLDDLANGSGGRGEVDPALADIARRYRAFGQSAAPAGARERVQRQIVVNDGGPCGHRNGQEPPRDATWPGPGAHGRVDRRPAPRQQQGTLWESPSLPAEKGTVPSRDLVPPLPQGPAYVARFLLLLVILSVGILLSGSGRDLLDRLVSPRTLLAPETLGISGAETAETLLEVTVPAAMVPVGDAVTSCLSQITVPPHARATWDAQDALCCPGARLNYVLTGTYLVWPEEAVQVMRAGGQPEEMPAGSELTLHAGDAVLMGSDTSYSADNPAETPVELLQMILSDPANFPRGTATLAGWDEPDYDVRFVTLHGGPMTMRLHRFTLAAKATLQSPPDIILMQVSAPPSLARESIDVAVDTLPDGTIRNLGRTAADIYVLSLQPSGINLMP